MKAGVCKGNGYNIGRFSKSIRKLLGEASTAKRRD
jgi:hypothetical protein